MSEKTIKRTHKIFYICDYDKEEQYLTEMHAKGWKFVPYKEKDFWGALGGQVFEACEPGNVVYKIGFNPVKKDIPGYVQMFEDYGWEPCGSLNDYYYFRKSADGVSPEELDIFSDDESRLDMAKRALKARLPLLLILTCCILIPQTIRLIMMEEKDLGDWLVVGSYGICWAIYLWAFIRSFTGYRRLKNKFDIKDKV